MIDVGKSVQSMQRLFTWVSFFLTKNLAVEEGGCGFCSHLFDFDFISGTLLMTPERKRAIWAIYGNFDQCLNLTMSFMFGCTY